MLRDQRYPEVRNATDGGILAPYDVATWSLPLSMGVEVIESAQPLDASLEPLTGALWPTPQIDKSAKGHLIPAAADSAYTAINRLLADGKTVTRLAADAGEGRRGDIYLSAKDVKPSALREIADELHLPVIPVEQAPKTELLAVRGSRVGLFKPWVASMDEGWTRFVLENYEFPLESIANEEIRSGEFADQVDVLLFPDVDSSIIAKGKRDSGRYGRFSPPLPPQYSGGIDEWKSDGDVEDAKAAKKTKGGKLIKEWVENGGTVVALDSSSAYFIELFGLPVQQHPGEGFEGTLQLPGIDFEGPDEHRKPADLRNEPRGSHLFRELSGLPDPPP